MFINAQVIKGKTNSSFSKSSSIKLIIIEYLETRGKKKGYKQYYNIFYKILFYFVFLYIQYTYTII